MPALETVHPPSLNHFVIFNPTLKPHAPQTTPSTPKAAEGESASDAHLTLKGQNTQAEETQRVENKGDEIIERDKDLEDDLAQASQILFYTSREAGGVSRDKMLRQVGLIKGLMGFNDMIIPNSTSNNEDHWVVHTSKSRMLVYIPEPDFYLYVNIALASELSATSGKYETTLNAQGLSDGMLVDMLRRGYEDFVLLHGPLSNFTIHRNSSNTLDKFFTRFAFTFESIALTPHPDPLSLDLWLGSFIQPPSNISTAIEGAISIFKEDTDSQGDIGIINKDGPLTPTNQSSLNRYLHGLLKASLPVEILPLKEVDRVENRKTSWVGWMPSMSFSSRSVTPSNASDSKGNHQEGKEVGKSAARRNQTVKVKGSHKWPNLGLGSITGIPGVFGKITSEVDVPSVPKSSISSQPRPISQDQPLGVDSVKDESQTEAVSSIEETNPVQKIEDAVIVVEEGSSRRFSATSNEVLDTAILKDLVAAQNEPDLHLKWDSKKFWLKSNSEYIQKKVIWLLRDNMLLYIISDSETSVPSNQPLLSLLSKVNSIISPTRPSMDVQPNSIDDDFVLRLRDGGIEKQGPEENMMKIALRELRDIFNKDESVSEVYGRTSSSKFIVGKKLDKSEEIYLGLSRKEASLTDAESILRQLLRQ